MVANWDTTNTAVILLNMGGARGTWGHYQYQIPEITSVTHTTAGRGGSDSGPSYLSGNPPPFTHPHPPCLILSNTELLPLLLTKVCLDLPLAKYLPHNTANVCYILTFCVITS